MTTIPIQIVRRQGRELIPAELHPQLSPSVLIDTEKEWGPIRKAAAQKLVQAGRSADVPEHYHWDWETKSSKLSFAAYRCCGIECAGKTQGLVLVKFVGWQSRLDPDVGKPLVYVSYLETAPWNLATMVDSPEYSGIGSVLMHAVVQISVDEGFHGRVGLHTLPQSEAFYRDICEMHCCGHDPYFEDLAYYELTREAAARFLSKSSGGAQ